MEPELKDLPLLPGQAPSPEYLKEREKRDQAISDYYAARALELSALVSIQQRSPVFFAPQTVELLFEAKFFTRKARDELRELRNSLTRTELSFNGPARAMALIDRPTAITPRIFLRGSPDRPGDEVPRRFIAAIAGEHARPFENGSGRLELGRAIASRDNPLTARVFVNRVWAHHFGAGLVRTPSDFGIKGETPTHPELLDWLASDFMEGGWSIKKLHRSIMLSSAYQQSSDGDPRATQADPENRLLARMNRRRLDYEALRDSLLCVTGQLDRTVGGRPVEITAESSAKRRTVYAFIDRQNLPGVFRIFDFASPDATSPQRYVTTVPQQALFMLNSPFVLEQASALVAGSDFSGSQPREEEVQQLYRRLLARNAAPEEVRAGLAFLAMQTTRNAAPPDETPEWTYGFGGYDEATGKVKFQPLRHWTGYGWQGGKELPDPTIGWVMLSREGGHPGGDGEHCAIRRWTAPNDGTVSVRGMLTRPSKEGDGIVGLIVASHGGQLAKAIVEPGAAVELAKEGVEVKRGETIDFIVGCRGQETSDSFSWAPVVHGAEAEWSAQADFSGPRPARPAPLTPWQKYAQVLLSTNEFAFVD